MSKRLPKAEASRVQQLNGFEFEYGIKLNIKQFRLDCVHVQPSFETPHKDLRQGYIDRINKMKIKDAIVFIEQELDYGYLSNAGLYLVNEKVA